MASLQKKGNSYYIVQRIAGRCKWFRVGKVDAHTAKRCLKQFESDSALNSFKITQAKPITLKQFIDSEYLPWSKSNKAPASSKSEGLSCKHLIDYLKDILISQIDQYSLDRYITERTGKVSNRTINIELTCLNQMLNKAVEWGFIENKPIPKIRKLKEIKKAPRFLTIQELNILMQKATAWLKPFITFAVNTGMRAGEISYLKWEHVDLANRLIKVANDVDHLTKSRRDRVVYMNNTVYKLLLYLKDHWIHPNTLEALKRQPNQEKYVFCDDYGNPIKSFYKSYIKAVRKAGLKGVNVHTLRHTFASYLAQNGQSVYVLKELLGHSEIKTTQIYAHISGQNLRDAVMCLED